MNSFADLAISPEMSKAIKEMGFETPSPIQQQALPILLGEPTDFIGLAATGTGKTAAFGIPLLERIKPELKQVQALIMCPTRELALQVTGQINLLGKFKGIKAVPVYGGAGYGDQIQGLKQGAQVVVGTPGRITDHLERGTLKFYNLKTIILDEADEMISMGFKDDIEKIIASAKDPQHNIWLFSATMSKEVRKVADTYLKDPQMAQVNRTEMLSSSVEQIFYPTRESDKPEILCKILDAAAENFYGIIFCQTKLLVTNLAQFLQDRGYRVETLHGDKSQADRERTLKAFRDRKTSILICTDVASRGLDVKDITHVVNYSLPRELDVYVHRIGRTARSGKTGIAISLVTPAHRSIVKRLEAMTKTQFKEGKIPTRKEIGAMKVTKMLEQFRAQTNYPKAVALLGVEWLEAIAEMAPEEIVGRFLTMLSPDIFEVRERTKAALPPIVKDTHGNTFRERREDDRRAKPTRRERGESKRPSKSGSFPRWKKAGKGKPHSKSW